MRTKLISVVLFTTLALSAFAHPHGAEGSEDGSALGQLVSALLPFLLIGVIYYLYLRYAESSPRAKQTEDYMLRRREHMEKVERALERIADALERKDKHGP